jgi:hypothetical protein
MYVSPNHPDPPRPAGPPPEQGVRFGTFPRGDGVEMRVCLAELNGNPYVSIRV